MQEINSRICRPAAVLTRAATIKVKPRQAAHCAFVVAVSVALTACGGAGTGAATNGALILDSVWTAVFSGRDFVKSVQQRSSSTQNRVVGNSRISIQSANDTGVAVACCEFFPVANSFSATIDPASTFLYVANSRSPQRVRLELIKGVPRWHVNGNIYSS
jgi:hypothetical protein